MFAKSVPFALALAACAPPADPPAAHVGAKASEQGIALATACESRDGWGDAAPPARIYGNTFYVGTCGISVLLITSPEGHILIDGAVEEAVPGILANIRALGFNPRDVRALLFTHEHYDHMGGLAALASATGAPVYSSAAARAVLESGEVDPADPQFGLIQGAAPVQVTHEIEGIASISIGENTVVPVATPGHTTGGTSWNWQSCETDGCLTIAYVDSMSAVSRDDYRFSDHPERVAPFRATFRAVSAMPCDVLVTPHPSFSDLFARLSGAAPLRDPGACRDLSEMMRQRLDARLQEEARN